jgi:hypothetical protein
VADILIAKRFHIGSFHVVFFHPDQGGEIFFRNFWWLSMGFTASYHRRYGLLMPSSLRTPCLRHLWGLNGTSEALTYIYKGLTVDRKREQTSIRA